MKKIAVVISHPIQYYAPLFQLLEKRNKLGLKVFYTWSQTNESVEDKVFGKTIKWDIPLREGYDYEFVDNVSKKPGSHHFFGIDNPTLIAKIEAFQPDAILFFGWNFKSHLLAMRHFKGKIPVWFRGDSTLLDEVVGLKTTLRRLVLRKVYSYVDKAFFVGEASKAYFLKHGLKPDQLVCSPHAIDNDRFSDEKNPNYLIDAKNWRESLGYSSEDILIVFSGKLESKKQPDFLIKAFNKAKKEGGELLKLLIIGSGPLEEKLKEFENDDIKFLTFQNQKRMPLVYRMADVYCLPSKGPGETWGLAVNESMASGRSVIVSNKVGCVKDLVSQNKTGFVFSYDNLLELKDILVNLNKSELKLMGEKARLKIMSYNFSNIVKAFENELNE
ncbi:glycosyltransferase family 4 protein [Winogradskyella sp. SYSU M77433]|uniref:glycosyltransferase family 4 protein n=1 Tax=Winogradskyella sp. SYSU M77433 TaxID=3042722 RepID=UPI0024805E09|nr:glycosyltransferase family 4 protein [Winogradskyella sp. SYSU M77433]MDH7911513.1 glycosyltransferase family 4 protein [Winogradskyella sp. SYSU M77433]